MPLWTTTRRPVQSRWGWAFSSVGRPWVAQRVWPMPKVPWMGSLCEDVFEVAELAGGAAELEAVAIAADGDAGGVVAAIFEAAESFNDDGDDFRTVADVTDDAAHRVLGYLRDSGRDESDESCRGWTDVNSGHVRGEPQIGASALSHICRTNAGADMGHPGYSRRKENSSITGLVRTSRAMRSTSARAAGSGSAVVEGELKKLALADVGDSGVAHFAQGVVDGLSLGVEDGFLEGHIDMSLHCARL